MVNIFGYISESKYMVPSTGKNKTRLRLDQLGLSLLRGLHVCFVSFEGLTHAKQRKVADWKHQTPIQPKHEATSRSSCRRCLSSASSACSTCPHLQSQAITDQWWIAPLGHRICLKNPKTMRSLAPKNWFLRQISCILDSSTISASYEVSQAQKAILLPHAAKGQARHRKSCTDITTHWWWA